jgi:group I intron endonuclease
MAREKRSGIYCIENTINGKKYIGLSIDVILRMNKKHKHSTPLINAIEKYGKESFIKYVVEYCDAEDLQEREMFYIKEWKTKVPDGYNLTDGGEGNTGYHPSEDTKKKMSNIAMGRKKSDETKHKMSESRLGIHFSSETLEKMSEAKKGIPYNEERKKEAKERMRGETAPRYGTKLKNASSQYFGVYKSVNNKNKKYSYWAVIFKQDDKYVHLGGYKDEIDAARAYDKYIIENKINHSINFPEDYSGQGG